MLEKNKLNFIAVTISTSANPMGSYQAGQASEMFPSEAKISQDLAPG